MNDLVLHDVKSAEEIKNLIEKYGDEGFCTKIPDPIYHASEGYGSTTMWEIYQNPAAWAWNQQNRREREETEAMKIGSAVHCLILAPEEWKSRFVAYPEHINRRTNDGKAQYKKFCEDNAEKIVLKQQDMWLAERIRDFVRNNRPLQNLLKKCEKEVAVYKRGPDGRLWRGKWDMADFRRDVIVDLKTTTDLGPRQEPWASRHINRSIYKYGYHCQAAHYSALYTAVTGRPLRAYIWLFVQKRAPTDYVLRSCPRMLLAEGEQVLGTAMLELEKGMTTGQWTGYDHDIKSLDV